MPTLEYQKQLSLTAGGGTHNLPVTDANTTYHVTSSGSVTLAGSWTIQSSGTPYAGSRYVLHYDADVSLGGNQITFFGVVMPQGLTQQKCIVIAYYNGAGFLVNFVPSADIIQNTALVSFGKGVGVVTEVTGTGNDGNAVVYINGVATTLSASIEGSAATIVTSTGTAANGLAFTAGQRIGVKVTNVAGGPTSFTNTTATVEVVLV